MTSARKQTNKPEGYRADIDGLRAVAIILVMVYHFFPTTLPGGFIGVDIFFVISGYLITGIILKGLRNGTFSFGNFYKRRIRRIFPVFIVVISACYAAGWILLLPVDFMALGKQLAGAVGFVANFTLWQDSGYFDALPEVKPLLHFWSLSLEEQFYLVWPLLLFFTWKKRHSLIWLVAAATVTSFVLNIVFVSKYPEAVFYFPLTRFWEPLLGAILAFFVSSKIQLHEYCGSERLRWILLNLLSLAGVSLIVCAAAGLEKTSLFPGWWALCPTLGSVALIGAGPKAAFNSRLLASKAAVWVGLISYPLYLWHWPILSFAYISTGAMPSPWVRLGLIVISVTLSWFSFAVIEKPFRQFFQPHTRIFRLVCIPVLLGILGLVTYSYRGISARTFIRRNLPEDLIAMLSPDFGGHIAAEWREHKCFLTKEEEAEKFSAECLDGGDSPLVLLWGDSHAATLYFGLKEYQHKREFRVAQYTSSACPPVLDWDGAYNKNCRHINDSVLNKIVALKPNIVVLEAAWYWDEYDWRKVIPTIQKLRDLGVPNIILIGAIPGWTRKVPANILEYYSEHGRLPVGHTKFGLFEDEKLRDLDRALKVEADKLGITFISLRDTLCDHAGCLLSVGTSIKDVISLDQGHLSSFGAKFVIESVAKEIFRPKG